MLNVAVDCEDLLFADWLDCYSAGRAHHAQPDLAQGRTEVLPAVEQSGVDGAELVHGEQADGSVALEAEELLHSTEGVGDCAQQNGCVISFESW